MTKTDSDLQQLKDCLNTMQETLTTLVAKVDNLATKVEELTQIKSQEQLEAERRAARAKEQEERLEAFFGTK